MESEEPNVVTEQEPKTELDAIEDQEEMDFLS